VKQRVTILCLAAFVPALMIGCQAGGANNPATSASPTANSGPSTAKADKTAVVNEIRELLAKHDKALSDKSLDAVMSTFSTDANTVVLGTGAEEKWVGPEEIKSAYTEIFKDYDPGTLQTNCDWKTGSSDDAGTMAWLAAICAAKDSLQGKPREYKLNVSATVQKQDGNWHFVMLHMSNAFQPPVTK
jgi:ketosteroid isomerase-like protein